MCGISGWWRFGDAGRLAETEGRNARAIAGRMADALAHRGPDDAGSWFDDGCGLALVHRRLAILDLSPAGRQPMASACGRFVVVFNGEIYNHLEIREELRVTSAVALAWRGHSDTETLLAAIAGWGLEKALKRTVGMFALALWDRQERTLTLARDRLGEKPLYYGRQGETFFFASELKALKAHPCFEARIDRQTLALFLRFNYVPAPWSIYQGVRKLPPGTFLVVGEDGREQGPVEYWSARAMAEAGQREPFSGDEAAALAELERLLRRAVAGQMVADVPLGAFLSGGIDSSTVVALMQAQASRPVKTFSIGFSRQSYDEAGYARAVAARLGTDHTELYVTPAEAQAVIPRLPEVYDEPFADSSQIPTLLVAQLARQQVTVALSGDGGDELFGGYNRHCQVPRLWQRCGGIPIPLRRMTASLCTALPPSAWDLASRIMARAVPGLRSPANPGDKLHKLAGVLAAPSPQAMYEGLSTFWLDDEAVVVGDFRGYPPAEGQNSPLPGTDVAHAMMYQDLVTYLPDDILVKVDRAAMAVSLETRIPLLDHRLVEFAWRLPLAMKIRNGQGKWLLRQLLFRYVPEHLVERPKMGFGVPLDGWLRGPLREWAEGLLAGERLRREGFLNPTAVRRKWDEHLSGRRNWAYHLWGVLMFQAWLERNR